MWRLVLTFCCPRQAIHVASEHPHPRWLSGGALPVAQRDTHARKKYMSCRVHFGQELHDAAPCVGAALHDAAPGVGAPPAAQWPPPGAPSGDGVVACCPPGCAVQSAGGAGAGGPDADWPPAGAAQAVPATHATGGPCSTVCAVQGAGCAGAGGPDADWPPAGAAQTVPATHATGGPVACCREPFAVQDCGFPLDPHEAPRLPSP